MAAAFESISGFPHSRTRFNLPDGPNAGSQILVPLFYIQKAITAAQYVSRFFTSREWSRRILCLQKKKKYVDLGRIIVSHKIFGWTVGRILVAVFLTGMITLIVKTVSRHHHKHPSPDNYTLALRKALKLFNAQRSRKFPKHNNVSWKGNSGMQEAKYDPSLAMKDLVGGLYDTIDAIKFNFSKSFAMIVLSWSAIEVVLAPILLRKWLLLWSLLPSSSKTTKHTLKSLSTYAIFQSVSKSRR